MRGTISAAKAAPADGLPDANDLLLFACVMEAGSFSRAAQRCGLPKSTVSRRIAALEAGLGERLLTRTTRQLAITEFGERILDHARRLLEETEAAPALAQHRQAAPRGTLRVSLPPDFDELNLAALLPGFVAGHPEVRVELDLSPRRADLVAERFDLAVRVAARLPDDATLVARRIADLGHGLYASPGYLGRAGRPASPQELSAHTGLRLIASGGEVQPWRLASGAERCEVLPSGPLAANSIGLLRELAARHGHRRPVGAPGSAAGGRRAAGAGAAALAAADDDRLGGDPGPQAHARARRCLPGGGPGGAAAGCASGRARR